MKHYPTKSGPFVERPFFSAGEIEDICTEALRSVDLYPTRPEPVRIERFVEKRFQVTPSYEDLPDGVLGLTEFTKAGVKAVVIGRALDDDGGIVAERRIRTTLAHEGGHCLLHAHLFALATPESSLFGDFSDPTSPKVLCRGEADPQREGAYHGKWWEFQANKAIGGLLMPRPLVETALADFFITSPMGFKSFDWNQHAEAGRQLSEAFDVNPAVARIRLSQVFPVDTRSQLTL